MHAVLKKLQKWISCKTQNNNLIRGHMQISGSRLLKIRLFKLIFNYIGCIHKMVQLSGSIQYVDNFLRGKNQII